MNHPDWKTVPVENYREYVLLLAHANMGKLVLSKSDPHDLVQQTLLDAHLDQTNFRGTTEDEFLAWLRQILVHNIIKLRRAYGSAKRDASREQSLQADLERSSMGLAHWLQADLTTPSQHLQRHEQASRLSGALEQLTPAQREAMLLRHIQGLTFAEIAQELNISAPSVVGLLRRGAERLRTLLGDQLGSDSEDC